LGLRYRTRFPCYEPIYVEKPEVFSGDLGGVLDGSDPTKFTELVRKNAAAEILPVGFTRTRSAS